MEDPPVYLNGEFLRRSQAAIPVDDLGWQLGLGAFETMRAYDGRIFRLRAHLTRLSSTLQWLDIDLPEGLDALADTAHELVVRNGLTEARVRLTVSAGAPGVEESGEPTRLITVGPVDPPPEASYRDGIAAIRWPLTHGIGPFAGRKVTSFLGYVLARREAKRRDADEALLVGSGDRLVEGAFSNVFVVSGGRVMTPPLEVGALPGITRQTVLELMREQGLQGGESLLTSPELMAAEEVFVTSSVAEVVPVTRIDGRPVGDGQPGPVTRMILGAYRDRVRR